MSSPNPTTDRDYSAIRPHGTLRYRPILELDATIARIVDVLDQGRWATGDDLDASDRELLRWHLELARAERRRRR